MNGVRLRVCELHQLTRLGADGPGLASFIAVDDAEQGSDLDKRFRHGVRLDRDYAA